MKHRLQRVEEAIKRELGEIITRTLSFGEALPTIHDVSIAPDLRNCHVYMGVLGKQRTAEEVLEKLRNSAGMLQVALAKRVILKYTPHLHFHLDSSVERGVRILQILDDIPPYVDEEPAAPAQGEQPVFDTDAPDKPADDEELDALDDEDEDEEDDEPSSAAPARKRDSGPRKKRVDTTDL